MKDATDNIIVDEILQKGTLDTGIDVLEPDTEEVLFTEGEKIKFKTEHGEWLKGEVGEKIGDQIHIVINVESLEDESGKL